MQRGALPFNCKHVRGCRQLEPPRNYLVNPQSQETNSTNNTLSLFSVDTHDVLSGERYAAGN